MGNLTKDKLDFFSSIINNLPCQLLVIDKESNIVYANNLFAEEHDFELSNIINKNIKALFPDKSLPRMLSSTSKNRIMFKCGENICVQSTIWQNENIIGAIELCFLSSAFENLRLTDDSSYDDLEADIQAIFRNNYDVIYASDGNGITQKVSSACEELWGHKAEELIGRSVYELEKEGIYTPSITRLVLESKQRVQSFQVTKTGRKLIVIGTPITNQNGEIIQVINLSRDISSEQSMQTELASIKILLEAYKHEIDELRSKNLENSQLVYSSEAMANVVRTALKVSDVNATVLVTGESGVGKDIVASFIHANSTRKDKQYIKINCGAIPDSLLESELFGYEKGAFTGASNAGKLGLFELANQGTLFLDEISETSLNMQVKLLRVLQDGTFTRVGGVKQIKVDVRVIAASNRDMEKEILEGRFRKDLYYRLNVFPIKIPALKERPEDISPLTMFFINYYNKRYQLHKTLDQEVLQHFCEYSWPGNIRELQNIIERLVVLSEKDSITISDLPVYILADNSDSGIKIKRIMPLKDAVNSVEQQLIQLAMDKYGTTTQAAYVLGVDQSTISRKLKKHQ